MYKRQRRVHTGVARRLDRRPTIPPDADDIAHRYYYWVDESGAAYLRKVAAAGGFPAYEKAHRQALATKFAAKAFPRLPTDVAGHVVVFAFHVGYY